MGLTFVIRRGPHRFVVANQDEASDAKYRDGKVYQIRTWDYSANFFIWDVNSSSAIYAMGSVLVSGTNNQGQGNFCPAQFDLIGTKYAIVGLGYDTRTTTDTLHLVDITSPTAPVNVAFKDTSDIRDHMPTTSSARASWSGVPGAFLVDGNYLYMVFRAKASSDTFRVFDISDPLRPRYVSGEAVTTLPTFWGNALVKHGNYIVIGMETSHTTAMAVLDVSDIVNPRVLSYVPSNTTLNEIRGLAISGDYLYASDWDNFFTVFDFSNPSNPVQLGSCGVTSGNYGVHIVYPYAILANENTQGGASDTSLNLNIIDISDPMNPTRIMTGFGRTKNINGLSVNGNRLFLSEYASTGGKFYVLTFAQASIPFAQIGSAKVSDMNVTGNTQMDGSLSVAGGLVVGGAGIHAEGPGKFQGVAISSGPGGYVCHDLGPRDALPISGAGFCDYLWLTTNFTTYRATEAVTSASSWKAQ
jgi:hypothetical protein